MTGNRLAFNFRGEAKILGFKDMERKRIRRAQIGGHRYVSPFEQQLNEIGESIEFKKKIGQLDMMLADITHSGSRELIGKTRQLILTYADIWKIDIGSGSNTGYLPFDFFAQIEEVRAQLGPEEFNRQRTAESDQHQEMRRRVHERFLAVLGEIIENPQIPPFVQEKARSIYDRLH